MVYNIDVEPFNLGYIDPCVSSMVSSYSKFKMVLELVNFFNRSFKLFLKNVCIACI